MSPMNDNTPLIGSTYDILSDDTSSNMLGMMKVDGLTYMEVEKQ